jgi:site-specific DNA-methyltransferase (adenine-specific)
MKPIEKVYSIVFNQYMKNELEDSILFYINRMIIQDLILQLRDNSITKLLDDCSNFSERGCLYETLWSIVVKFNCLPNISIRYHVKSNLNKKTKLYIKDFSEDFLLSPVRSGNSGGYSDITFIDNNDNLYVSTSKFFENEEGKSRDDWDLPKLTTLSTIHGDTKNIVFAKNKSTFLKIYNNANKNDIHHIDNVYDLEDLIAYMKNVVQILELYKWNFDELLLHYFGKEKHPLKLLFHQKLCLSKTSRMKTYQPILWGLKCRSGKSYIMAGHIATNQFSNVLIITPIPNESIRALVKMFRELIDFDKYTVTHFYRGVKLPECDKRIIIASKQFLDGKSIAALNAIDFDAVYSDENHWGGTTENSKKIVSTYVKKNTQFITLTATYSKSQYEWKIPNEQSFFWDLEDEMLCKQNNIERLVEKFGNDVTTLVKEHNIATEYNEMPLLTLLSVTHDPTFVSKFKQFNTDDSYSFDTTELLKCENGSAKHKTNVDELLDYHFGNGLNNGMNMMDRIKKYNSRTKDSFHTQLWFLPYGGDNKLNDTANVMKTLIESHKYGKKFAVEILTSENDKSEKGELFEYISALEENAIHANKSGLILLLGFKCSMGISLSLADVVVLLNNGQSMDMYMQMMMRSMTEDKGKNKKRGFVIDYNQKRVLQTTLNIVRGSLSIRDNIEKSLNVVHVDEDMCVRNKTAIVDKIYDIWKRSKINRIDFIRSRLEQLPSVEFDKDDYKKISSFMKNISVQKDTKEKEKLELNDDAEKLSDAVSVYTESNSRETYEEEVIIDYGKELLTSIPILAGLLTYKNKELIHIVDCLEFIQKNEYLSSVFMSQCRTWWGFHRTDGFIELLIQLIRKYYLNVIQSINNEMELMKDSIAGLLENKKELLDMINSMLKPKDIEKRKHGEVFTPLEWVEKMLDLLPNEVWTNETLKWYDPACGIGNFPVCVYYRLMESLKRKFPNEEERKMHIVHNMLYMSELNSKNVFICKTIFGDDCNIYEGDSLSFDVESHWNLSREKIIVIGNPPYNKELTRSGASPLYNQFIEKYIDVCFYLLFIVPSRWFSGGKGLDKFREMMLSRSDIEKIVHIQDSKTVFGNTVDIEGGINYFLKNKKYNGLCNFNNSMIKLSKFDVLIDNTYQSIIDKVTTYKSITDIYQGRCFGIETNDKHLTNDSSLVKCYVSKQKGFEKYISEEYIHKEYNFWKVVTAEANGKRKCFGNIFIASPEEIHSGSYISFKVDSELEAKSLKSYLECKLPNLLLSLRKSSQHINESTCKWIPLPPLDRTWNDKDVYKYFNLTASEIKLID